MVEIRTEKNPLVIIAGPTAVGKTEFALHAASRFNGEIVSCDSMQIYRYMDIGTAKPSKEELACCPHHLIDIIDPSEAFSSARYAQLARQAVADIANLGKLPILCGGTGLYLDGVLYEMEYGTDPEDGRIREELIKRAETEGPLALHEELKEKDPSAAEQIHPNNVKRMIRALERIYLGEERIRPFNAERTENPDIEPLLIGLEMPREELYERINARVDIMVENGLVEEVRGLMERGLSSSDISMQGIGYKEIMAYIEGDSTLDEAVERIKTGSRHYAKRQFTWFRRYDKMKWIDISDHSSREEAMAVMDEIINEWLNRVKSRENG